MGFLKQQQKMGRKARDSGVAKDKGRSKLEVQAAAGAFDGARGGQSIEQRPVFWAINAR